MFTLHIRGRRGSDRVVVGFITTYAIIAIITNAVGSNLGQHFVIKLVSDLRQVGGFLLVIWFPPSIKLTATI